MSQQDRFDWNEGMDYESETDGQEKFDDFEDPLDGFDDYDEMPGFEDLAEDDAEFPDAGEGAESGESEATEVVKEGLAEKIPTDAKVVAALKKQKRRRGISAMGLGFLFTASILVAGVGIGGAILLAEGVHPATLWQPQNLLQIDQLLNFADHPLNILYMVTIGIIFLALLGSYKMSKAAIEANVRTREAEDILDSITALSLDKQEDWQSQVFKEYPPAEAFVIRTLGAWRLQEARQKRLMGVEGELHRLEKALNTNSRADLTGRFDHPAVGRLADEMIRYFDGRDNAVQKLEEFEGREQENTTESLNLLQDSRQWNGATLDNLGVQCASLDDLVGQMDSLVRHIEEAMAEAKSTEGMTDIIEGVRRDLAAQSSGSMAAEQTVSELNDLVDRGSKLAFKIAMEVARLGPRGERLLPMSQSLEDLTTGFRQLTDRVNDRDGGSTAAESGNSIQKKLETLAAHITQEDNTPWRDMADEVQDFGPAAAQVSGKLTRMIDGFNEQEDRLVQLGKSFADLTGADFDSSSIPRKELSDAPVSSLGFINQDAPAVPEDATKVQEPLDPFATAEPSILSPGRDPEGPDGDAEMPTLDLEGPASFSLNVESPLDMPLSGDGEKVYDLGELGASPAEGPETEDQEQVFDLSSFDAMPMAEDDGEGSDEVFELSDFDSVPLPDEAGDPAEEEVFELSDFGAESVVDEQPVPEEEVFDLSTFGATPLDLAVGAEQDDAAVEDDVFDLSDFGAKPMN